MEAQLAAASRTRFCAEVPVTCIPANYRRKRLPRQARFCYVEEPIDWDETDQCYVTRIGSTPQAVACARPVRLSVEEAEAIFQALDDPTSEEQPVYAAPSYLLPEALRELDGSRSYDLFDELAQTMRSRALPSSPLSPTSAEADGSPTDVPEDVSLPCRLYDSWFVTPTSVTDDEGRCLVTVAPLAHRLSGRSSGAVYTVWLDAAMLEQAMPVDDSFAHLDCHEQRVQVNAFAIEHEAIPPKEESEPVRRGEAAFTATTLEEQYQLVPLKDPIYLRKEDVVARSSDAETITLLDTQSILTNAIAQVQHEQVSLAQQHRDGEVQRLDVLLRCLEETLHWYGHLPRHKRGERILSVSARDDTESQDEFPRQRGHRRQRCIRLVVGVPTTLPLPWSQLADACCWPQQRSRARTGPQHQRTGSETLLLKGQAAGARLVA
jgi:hypothetical protein